VIEVHLETGAADLPGGLLERAVRGALEARGIEDAEVSLTLLDDEAITALNLRHLDHDGPTDVLAFALWEPGEPLVVGDVYVGYAQALRQAADEGVDPLEELVRLAAHGALHVCGMEHPDAAGERAASEMYRLQERVVREVLAERSRDA
jgi:probable rRNA maturation factor